MTRALLVGEGGSLDQWREYCVFQHWDYIIGTHLHLDDPEFEYSAYVVERLSDCAYVETLPQGVQELCYTTEQNSRKTGVQSVPQRCYFDYTPTLQMRLALSLGVEHCTTVAWDWRYGSARLWYSPQYTRWKGVQEYRVDRKYWQDRVRKIQQNLTAPLKKFSSVEHLDLRLSRVDEPVEQLDNMIT